MMNTISQQDYITVKSCLTTVRGIYQVILYYYDKNNKRIKEQHSLGFKQVAGNKNIAKQKQKELVRAREDELNTPTETVECKGAHILFGEYMKQWLETIKSSVELTTYASYKNKVEVIAEYFNEKGTTLSSLKRSDVKAFYKHLTATRDIKPQTIKRYHANIHKALNDAVDLELIEINPTDNMKLEKSEQYIRFILQQGRIGNII